MLSLWDKEQLETTYKLCSGPLNGSQREEKLFFLLPHKPGVLQGWFCSVWAECSVPVLYPWELEAALEALAELPCEHPSWILWLELQEPGCPRRNDAAVVGRAVWEMDWGFPGWFFKDG